MFSYSDAWILVFLKYHLPVQIFGKQRDIQQRKKLK